MKIGILTWYFGNNYGARAHTFALRNVVVEMGYECEFINYIPHKGFIINILSNLNAGNPLKHPIRTFRCFIRCLKFKSALKLNPHGKRVKNGVEVDAIGYDAIIIGSDAVLNIHHPQFETIYYGDGIKKTPFFTYAPSCEYMKASEIIDDNLSKSISYAIALSARDEITKNVLARMTRKEVKKVLDPAFLYDFAEIEQPLKEDKYLLVYSFSDWNDYSQAIRKYADEKNLKIISIGRYCSWADKSYDAISFYKWLGSFKHAEVVFTDSFHGAVFSVKNRKQMIPVARSDKRYKIQDLMNNIGVSEFNFYAGEPVTDYLEINKINYDRAAEIIEKEVCDSLLFLQESLCSAEKGYK